jgi:hypothetical protein
MNLPERLVAPHSVITSFITLLAMELMGATVTEKTRPLPSLDLKDAIETQLAGCARRISQLLKSPATAGSPEAQSALDDFLGAVYALIRAKQERFQNRPGRPIAIKPVAQRAARIAAGSIKTDGLWIAGFYFNNALFRTAAVDHRILKVITGVNGYVPVLQPIAFGRYPNWRTDRLGKVHSQVNELKHEPDGVYHGRTVTYDEALGAAGDLLDLIEAWAAANTSPPNKKP